MLLPLAYYGDPVLRKKGALIQEVNEEIKTLVQNMVDTLHEKNGLGLAAPQVHHSLALFMIQIPLQDPQDEDKFLPGELIVFINPKILKVSQEKWPFQEGCLSIPNVYEDVERPVSLIIEYTDLEGNRLVKEFGGMQARVIMHENDHINGVLFIDRIHGKKKQRVEKQIRSLKDTFENLKKSQNKAFLH